MSNVKFWEQIKNKNIRIIFNLEDIIQICKKRIEFASENKMNDQRMNDQRMNDCNKLIQTCETILDRTHKNIELINDKLQCSCCHKFIKDTIDVTPEYSMNITYCELCDLTL
jgi:hypothetical protein